MKKKSIIIILIVIMIVTGIVAARMVNDHKNRQIVFDEVSAVIEDNLQMVYSSHDAEEYGIRNIQYEIKDIQKEKHSYTCDYSFSVDFSCDADSDLDGIEKSLAAYAVEEAVEPFSNPLTDFKTSNGLIISVRNGRTSYSQVDTYINGELVHKNGEKISSQSTSKDTASDKNKQDAWNCATDVVRNELYSYSSVDVSSYRNSNVTYTSSTGIYTIKGTVSYKNQFNATVNNKFTVQLKLTEHGYSDSSILIY